MSAEEGAKPYQVLLASARPELAAAWRRLLGAEPGITLQAASAGDGRALVHHLANGSCPDVLLLDHSLLGQLGPAELDAMQRRLETLRVLLLCDEPTGALDFETGKWVLGLLDRLKRDMGKTVIIITHNTAIAPIADRVVRLRSGDMVYVHAIESPVPPENISF